MKQKKRLPRASLKEILGLSTAAARAVLRPRSLVHLDCAGALEIEHCNGVLCYNQQAIVLDMGKVCLRIEGDALRMDTFHKDFIRISGRFFSIHISYEGGASNGDENSTSACR